MCLWNNAAQFPIQQQSSIREDAGAHPCCPVILNNLCKCHFIANASTLQMSQHLKIVCITVCAPLLVIHLHVLYQASCFKVKTKKRYRNSAQPEAVILVVQDHFTKYIWLRVLASQDALHMAKALYDIFADFKCPVFLRTDKGSEFIN